MAIFELGESADGSYVDNFHQWIGRIFDPNELEKEKRKRELISSSRIWVAFGLMARAYFGVRFHLFIQFSNVANIGEGNGDVEFAGDFTKESIRATVHVIHTDNMIAGAEQLDDSVNGSQSRRKG